MVPGWRGKNFAAAKASARRAFITGTKTTLAGSPSGRCSAATATQPAAAACLAKCAPSALAPATAKNRKPALTLRLSAAMPVMSMPAKRGSSVDSGNRSASVMETYRILVQANQLSVPSPLVGEGQGGGRRERTRLLPPPPLTPPHKGGNIATRATGFPSCSPAAIDRLSADRSAAGCRAAAPRVRSPWRQPAPRSSLRWRSREFRPGPAVRRS